MNCLDLVTFLSPIVGSTSSYRAIHLIPLITFFERLPLTKRSIRKLPTLSYEQSLLDLTKIFHVHEYQENKISNGYNALQIRASKASCRHFLSPICNPTKLAQNPL